MDLNSFFLNAIDHEAIKVAPMPNSKTAFLAMALRQKLPRHSYKSNVNPFTAEFSDALYNASEKPFYQITHTIYLLETIHKIVPYGLGKPKTFLD